MSKTPNDVPGHTPGNIEYLESQGVTVDPQTGSTTMSPEWLKAREEELKQMEEDLKRQGQKSSRD